MSRWKQLPGALDPRVRQLVVHLRRVKDHSGLGLQALASRTGYSRSSWDRYLNGRALPPQRAVEALARACDTDPARLLALHEIAVQAGGAPESTGGAGPAGPDDPPPRGRRRGVVALVAAAVVALAALAVLALTAPWETDRTVAGRPAATGAAPAAGATTGKEPGAVRPGPFVFRTGQDHPCRVRRAADGLLYAGYSRTRTALLGKGSVQWAVVEAQCLLRHHGFPAGIADGMFGNHTERAVKRLQDKARIVVDGVIGEDTWGVLRG
ncbi:helix-turn-helix domain-containing protein [Streptomyces sp. NPDC005876]|uniref:helix-turn-helix domain-containing protein n=1 Tax=Streptomyces sp. NPDC005876 TaxID=3157076 RepID=UPI0033EDCE32